MNIDHASHTLDSTSGTRGLPQEIPFAGETKSAMESAYPAETKQAAEQINGILTEAMVISFSDRIMVSVSQEGRLAQWVSHYDGLEFSFRS